MPGLDKTGPGGRGPMTGGNRGLCRGMGGAGFGGSGRGQGGGFGLRRGQGSVQAGGDHAAGPSETVLAPSAEPVSGTELNDLRQRVAQVADLLHHITERLADLEAKK